ncbi:sugar phosphate isomerase/epimerase [Kibdelosporangium persicum]|uniref:Xylose isomerase domain-containing protein TIM barrel n=1 Tax=Kibdelosporangium persicum TaxID=2698649 RepID=A0ABX2FDZ9_9PSEU|nr:sugar phosphate isomerase/epimerase family protein [Kibdelosporangium persicum]NRN69043.1 Xylose isomerase domain-containing protein TIM barrel [Kibdelosporangium persicum]
MLGFSTLGCPGLPLADVAALARKYGIGLVELRCAADEPVHVGLSKVERDAALEALAGLRINALASYYRLCDDDISILADHVELAHDLDVPAIRIFPGRSPGTSVELAAERLAQAAEIAEGVTLLVETHDLLLRGKEIAGVLAQSGAHGVGAIWDVMHTWRAGETPAEAAEALLPWLGELQLKDAASATDRRPMVPGTGTVPIRETLDAARGFTGPIVLEHETKWYSDAAPFEESLAAFVAIMKQ